jgi:hypothetical protein
MWTVGMSMPPVTVGDRVGEGVDPRGMPLVVCETRPALADGNGAVGTLRRLSS